MSTGTGGDEADGHGGPSNISLSLADDGETWVAVDEDTGVASQGETREEALAMLDEAVALHEGEAGEPVTDEGLEEWGIDPDSVPDDVREPDAPWFDQE